VEGALHCPWNCNTTRTSSVFAVRPSIYQGLKSKVELAAAKAAALRINLNIVEQTVASSQPLFSFLRSPSPCHRSLTHHPFLPCLLVRGGQTNPHTRLVTSHSTCPPLSSYPQAHSFVPGTAVINTHETDSGSGNRERGKERPRDRDRAATFQSIWIFLSSNQIQKSLRYALTSLGAWIPRIICQLHQFFVWCGVEPNLGVQATKVSRHWQMPNPSARDKCERTNKRHHHRSHCLYPHLYSAIGYRLEGSS
jgi:hypothetical protein